MGKVSSRIGGTGNTIFMAKNIKSHFTNKGVGAVDALRSEHNNVHLNAFAMKQEYYVMITMSTYGKNEWVVKEKCRKIGEYSISFK